MSDYTDLQKAAAYAAQDTIKFADESEEMRALQQFHEEANPETVLALIAENEALRKDAERYRWLRDKSEAVHQFYLSVPLWFTGVRFRPQDVDNAIDAMGKGEQS